MNKKNPVSDDQTLKAKDVSRRGGLPSLRYGTTVIYVPRDRVLRSGSGSNGRAYIASLVRYDSTPNFPDDNCGFRIVRNIPKEQKS